MFLRICVLVDLWLGAEAEEPLICSQVKGSPGHRSGLLELQKKKNRDRRRDQRSHLQWFKLGGHHGQVLSLLAVKPLVRAWSKAKGVVCARQMLAGCCLVLKNRSVTKSAAPARFLLSGSGTFQTQLLLAMLRVGGGSGLPSLSPRSSCQHPLLPAARWRRLFSAHACWPFGHRFA